MSNQLVTRITADPRDLIKGLNRAKRSFKTFSKDSLKNLKQTTGAFKALTGTVFNLKTALLGVAGGVVFRELITTTTDFGKAMSGVKAVTRATEDQMQSLRSVAKQLGSTTAFSAGQAGEAMEFLGRAGFNANQIIKTVPATLALAAAGSLDLARAADIASNVLTGFNLKAEQMARVADVMAAAASSANTDIEQLGEGMKFVAPVAAGMGVSLEEATAAIGKLSDAGLQGSIAGTGLRRILSELESPAKKSRDILASLGLTTQDVAITQVGLTTALENLAKAGLDTGQALELFGDRGGPAFTVLASKLPGLQDLTRELGNVQGRAETMAKTKLDNVAGVFTEVKSAVEGLALQVGESGLTKGLRTLLEKLKELARSQLASQLAQKLGKVFEKILTNVSQSGDDIVKFTKRVILGMAGMVDTMSPMVNKIRNTVFGLYNEFLQLPSVVQEVGIVGLILGGTMGRVVLGGLLLLSERLRVTVNAFDALSQGALKMGDTWGLSNDELKELLKNLEKLGKYRPNKLDKNIDVDSPLGRFQFNAKKQEELLNPTQKSSGIRPVPKVPLSDENVMTNMAEEWFKRFDEIMTLSPNQPDFALKEPRVAPEKPVEKLIRRKGFSMPRSDRGPGVLFGEPTNPDFPEFQFGQSKTLDHGLDTLDMTDNAEPIKVNTDITPPDRMLESLGINTIQDDEGFELYVEQLKKREKATKLFNSKIKLSSQEYFSFEKDLIDKNVKQLQEAGVKKTEIERFKDDSMFTLRQETNARIIEEEKLKNLTLEEMSNETLFEIATGENQLQTKRIEAINELKGRNLGVIESLKVGWNEYKNQQISGSQQIINFTVSAFQQMEQGLGNAITAMINGTRSFKDSLKGIFDSILSSFVSMVAQMIAKWLAFQALTAIKGIFHGGGIIPGGGSGEGLFLGQSGEGVLTKEGVAKVGGKAGLSLLNSGGPPSLLGVTERGFLTFMQGLDPSFIGPLMPQSAFQEFGSNAISGLGTFAGSVAGTVGGIGGSLVANELFVPSTESSLGGTAGSAAGSLIAAGAGFGPVGIAVGAFLGAVGGAGIGAAISGKAKLGVSEMDMGAMLEGYSSQGLTPWQSLGLARLDKPDTGSDNIADVVNDQMKGFFTGTGYLRDDGFENESVNWHTLKAFKELIDTGLKTRTEIEAGLTSDLIVFKGMFANGGVVNGPGLAMVGERGPEAIIPLQNGAVPVRFGDSQMTNILANINDVLERLEERVENEPKEIVVQLDSEVFGKVLLERSQAGLETIHANGLVGVS